ncbi:DUF5103 domain-containing protein [Ancylomarina euxinus]|uniref:DUF5103 domain-containing protein n=1 Tax=Ancylomarina euxinus TaxID=2283627 RepID=A0A425XXW7_9BACT|nr:DUF5103 domain-containing protein [Ancylomarina euxinus]MCZ4695860.1 DUF5103 domain-containing protein [Ancylomarina euxinus]MUP16235.1 DUF5103 domain-containing protein [Ancylomarina euxinus]RRG19605.1 DUF5103 domain-containing protein [Ancylomarina euxinus]
MYKFLFRVFLISHLCISYCLSTFASEDSSGYKSEIIKVSIHTVQCHPVGWELSPPIVELSSQNQLQFSFDELGKDIQDYSYRIVHCNADWKSSGLSEFDFLDGFSENQIQDYEFSFNTNVDYVHYSLLLPNGDVKLKLSGNYILEVYQDFDVENIILRQRFMILDSKIELKGKVKHPIDMDRRKTHQEVMFSIFHPNFLIDNPHSDLTVILRQNDRSDGSQMKVTPIFIRKDELVFDNNQEYVFPGNNEFHYFDLKSFRYQSIYIQSIENLEGKTVVSLSPGKNRQFDPYIFRRDNNGISVVSVDERKEPTTEADYAQVVFTLPFDNELKHGQMYVYGAFNNWECNENNRMVYDHNLGSYQKSIYLKQGYYNYVYALLENGKDYPDVDYIEGSHWQTENNYMIYVYYHDIEKNYDRLIGFKTLNSTKDF